MATGLGDFRIVFRTLWRHPAQPVVVLLPLALAIAISAALFSIVDGLRFRPLPFEKPDELVAIDFRKVGGQIAELSYRRELAPEREALRAAVESSVAGGSQVGLASFFDQRMARDAGIEATGVDSRFFRVLGLTPLVGAGFSPEDEVSPALVDRDSVVPLPVIIGYGLWQRVFGGSAEVLGVHDLAGRRVRIVGVMGPGVRFPGDTNLWAPTRSDRNRPPAYARLARGSTADQLAARFPQLEVIPLAHAVRPTGTGPTVLLFAAASMLLLVGCVQIASLILSGAVGRLGEIGVRLALGAGHARLIGMLALENGVVAGFACLLAWLATGPLARFLVSVLPPELTRGQYLMPDARTFAFVCVISLLGLALLTFLPLSLVRRTSPLRLLAGDIGDQSLRTVRLRQGLLITQIALTALLLYLSGLTVHSFLRAASFDFGFDTKHVLLFTPPLPTVDADVDLTRYRSNDPLFDARYDEKLRKVAASLQRLDGTPGVIAAASFFRLPLIAAPKADAEIVAFDGRLSSPPMLVRTNTVSPDFVSALGARLIAGQSFSHPDYAGAENVVVVNETLARQLGGNVSLMGTEISLGVVGRRLRTRSFDGEIIGVIKDLVDRAPGIASDPQLFLPTYRASAAAVVAIRTSPTVDAALPAVHTMLQDIWGDLAPRQFSLMIDAWHGVLLPYRGQAFLLTLIAGSCLPLAAVGLTGALLYFVRARTRETAIRIALGADPVGIRRGVVLRALATAGMGVALGLVLGIAAGRVIATQLFEVRHADPLTIVSVIAVLLLVAWLAALAPAHHATRVDPAAALRQG